MIFCIQIMLDSWSIDGILYSSVAAKEPVIALHNLQQLMLQHQFVGQVLVYEHYGYEFYHYVNEKQAGIT